MAVELPHSDGAVARATGKTWGEWRKVLDAWGGTATTAGGRRVSLLDMNA